MEQQLATYDAWRHPARTTEVRSLELADVTAMGRRHKRLILISFLAVVCGAILGAVLQPSQFEATMKILIKRDRVDTLVTADHTTAIPQVTLDISEEELNSELELLKSRDVLEQVVLACNLQHTRRPGLASLAASLFSFTSPGNDTRSRQQQENIAVAKAVEGLAKDLRADVVKKTNLIEVSYASPDPKLAEDVLTSLSKVFFAKHAAVHRTSGAYEFFHRETERYREELNQAQQRLLDFDRQAGSVAPSAEKELALQKLAEFQVVEKQTNAAIAETQQRIAELQKQIASTPSRMVTQVRNSDDALLSSQLKANLLNLEQKRTELLQKFEPSYRTVQEVDQQIAQARAALAENKPIHDETTDRDPTYEWARIELDKAKADLVSLKARAAVTHAAVENYQGTAESLDAKEVNQSNIVRAIKSAEENLVLSQQKEEEARLSDALDRGRILNLSLAEPPNLPALPSNHRLRLIAFGLFFAILASAAAVFVAERTNTKFRTPEEIVSILEIPVLAAIPDPGMYHPGLPELSAVATGAAESPIGSQNERDRL